ncbi:hypothetical protein [Acidithiobacillus sp.]|uniref:hypothetical protein n=1 Tax=Acidithiobacillus sp. TaxID=1872118 RepID=UPI0035687243
MHATLRVPVNGQLRKTYLVSLMDDASRLITHSAFCLGETVLDIEGVPPPLPARQTLRQRDFFRFVSSPLHGRGQA